MVSVCQMFTASSGWRWDFFRKHTWITKGKYLVKHYCDYREKGCSFCGWYCLIPYHPWHGAGVVSAAGSWKQKAWAGGRSVQVLGQPGRPSPALQLVVPFPIPLSCRFCGLVLKDRASEPKTWLPEKGENSTEPSGAAWSSSCSCWSHSQNSECSSPAPTKSSPREVSADLFQSPVRSH